MAASTGGNRHMPSAFWLKDLCDQDPPGPWPAPHRRATGGIQAMRISGRVEIASAAVWLPDDVETPPPSHAAKELPQGILPANWVESLPVSHKLSAPEMAVLAARACLDE